MITPAEISPDDLSREKIATGLRIRADEHSAGRDRHGVTIHRYTDDDARFDEALADLLDMDAPAPKPVGWREAWPGIHKLREEMHELLTVLDKLSAFPEGPHPGHGDLVPWLTAEIGDVQAALAYFCDTNKIDADAVERRAAKQAKLFKLYNMRGTLAPMQTWRKGHD